MELEGSVEGCFNDPIKLPQVSQQPTKKCSSDGELPSPTGCFDCNICLDFATDPVVTLCGHLYCWPCIYKWLQVESGSPQHCPVCKAPLSENTLVPLYGRGHSTTVKGSQQSTRIPKRPLAHQDTEVLSLGTGDIYANPQPAIPRQRHQQHHHLHHHYYPYYNSYSNNGYDMYDHPLPTQMLNSTTGGPLRGIAALLLPLAFRNHRGPGMYRSSPYHLTTGTNISRLRQEMQLEKSLHQICVFLLCCALLCLLLF